ncbi:GntR family transcriptional regulator [Denitrobaculum tricleocarpae]|uniref:GntR family transcriptional regulator n=1 Tax=Denitrobaculum tricleocarpae TaxID=2591009 RepID=A0A545SSY7_9PROT|nr:GntR family transcriptional regulator [Denitrobaculum tricleocarpae]
MLDDRSAARQRADAIYEEIRKRICTNRYPPETRLHEEALASEFSVSRTRKAFRSHDEGVPRACWNSHDPKT